MNYDNKEAVDKLCANIDSLAKAREVMKEREILSRYATEDCRARYQNLTIDLRTLDEPHTQMLRNVIQNQINIHTETLGRL